MRVDTNDGLSHQGLLCPAATPTDRLVLHIHGSYGNFYENLFLDYLAAAYTASGTAFLTTNNRGHDYYADFWVSRPDGDCDAKRIGGIRERFEESVLDIRAWADFAAAQGFRTILLQGHSLGAMKAAFYGARGNDDRVQALILISPPDIPGVLAREPNRDVARNLALARKLSAEDPDALMPPETSYEPTSAASYLSLMGDPQVAGIFSFRDEAILSNPIVNSIRLPVIAVLGAQDEYIVTDAARCLDLLGRSLTSAASYTGKVLAGANHTYDNHEVSLAAFLADAVFKVRP